jgi:hypothetical protein
MEESLKEWIKQQLRYGISVDDIMHTLDNSLQQLCAFADFAEAINESNFRP